MRLAKRFWSKVDIRGPDECWPWLAGCSDDGYGRFSLHGVNCNAHRVAYELVNGPLPKGQVSRHTCDNRPCCNPRHLVAGTQQQNIADMDARGRRAAGEHNGNARFTQDEIKEIRRLRRAGWKLRELQAKFGGSSGYFSRLTRGEYRKEASIERLD